MYNSKLIQTIILLNSSEKELLKKWILSPAHNRHQEVQNLFIHLLNKRKLTARTSSKNALLQAISKEQSKKIEQLYYIMNLGMKILEDFIAFSSQKESHFSQKIAIVQFYKNRNQPIYAQQYIQKSQKIQEQSPVQNQTYYSQQQQLEQEIFEQKGTTTRIRSTNLQAIFDNQYIAFTLATLQQACIAITHQNLYNSPYKIPLLDSILAAVAAGEHRDIPAILLYYHSYKALTNIDDTYHFKQLKTLLWKYNIVLPIDELKTVYVIAINYCVRLLNTGLEEYVTEVFELYQYGLSNQILIENGVLSRFTYKNIVSAALRLQKYQWAEKFLKKYTPFLEPVYQNNYSTYAQAKLLFVQGNFNSTLQLLSQIEFDDLFLNMDAKLMLLKIYYEQKYFDSLDALITSFRRFLQRKPIIIYQKKVYENIINLTEKLLKLKPNKAAKTALQKEIESTNPLTERPWLLAQLHKLN